MKTISATFEVVTPMFLGGADQSPDGIRPSSIKGALRFWWRAWAWSGIRANCNDDNAGLQALHREEARLFGLAAQNDSGGQGLFMLHVRDSTRQSLEQPFGTGFDNGILYLLGQGLGEARPLHLGGNKCKGERGAIQAKETFEIRLIFKPRTTPQDQESILTALKLFGLLGALGSRARHGLGSVAIQSLAGQGIDNWKPPATEDEYVAQLSALMPSALAKNAPPLSALSQLTRIDLSSRHADATKLLDTVGKEQQAYRSYGQQDKKSGIHMVNGKPSESNFAKDHDLAMQVTQGNRVDKAPDRIVFGLPHNYFFSSLQKPNNKADVNYAPEAGEGRRASPLFLHVHKVGDVYVGAHLLLTAQFLPQNNGQSARVDLKRSKNDRNGSSVALPERDVKWQVLHAYLDRFHSVTYGGKTIYGKQ